MRIVDYTSLDEFDRRYYEKITKICAVSIDDNIEDTTDRAFVLWRDVRPWVNRKPTNLCFDCVYIIGNAMGNKNTVPFLTYISEQLFQRNIKSMYSKRSGRWFITDRGRISILTALAGSFSDIEPHHHELYVDAVGLWMTKEEE
jgi:hypothetical protein